VRHIEYAAVAMRAKGRCELCHIEQDPLDPHHAFGRGHLPGIPADICETRECILGICRPCHTGIHEGNEALSDYARAVCVKRFALRHQLSYPGADAVLADPLEVMRSLVRQVEEREG
jgi:hypothetical protein